MNNIEDGSTIICDIFNIQCGEVFLTMQGNILFHCTLCENKYKGFYEYADHLNEEHSPLLEIERLPTQDTLTEPKVEELCDINLSNHCSDKEVIIAAVSEKTLEDNEVESNEIIPDKAHMQNTLANNILKHNKKHSRAVRKNCFASANGKRFKCSECDFICKEYKNLVGHMKRHSDYRPHQCNECTKAFYTRFELNTHIRCHTGERPFLCPECGFGFITAGKLREHSKRHQNKRDKQCHICEMRFFNTQALRRHLTIHSSERCHKCSLCDASFKRRGALLNHHKLHENKREYRCELCPARFNQKPGLLSHMKSKHLLAESTSMKFECLEEDPDKFLLE